MQVKPRSRMGSYDVFERRYCPIPNHEDSILRDLDDHHVQNAEHYHVWTVLDCDGKLVLSPGFCFVNRFGYVLCEKPWPEIELSNPGYRY